MKLQYKTTLGAAQLKGDPPENPGAFEPPGDGWQLLSVAIDHVSGRFLYAWARPEVVRTKPCATCGALARREVNGVLRCVGCDTPTLESDRSDSER